MFPPHFNSQAINNPLTTGLEAGADLLLRAALIHWFIQKKKKKKKVWIACFSLSGLSGGEIQRSPCHERKDSDSGHVMSYNQIVLQCTFMKNFKVLKKIYKLASPLDIPKLILVSAVLSRWLRKSFFFFNLLCLVFVFVWFFFFCFAGEWSKLVCQWQGSLFSLTLITSFTNLQSYYSTVCKGVSAITSSMFSTPVMTTGPTKSFW